LVVIPCSYTIFDDLSNLISKWMGKPIPFGGAEGYGAVESTEKSESVDLTEAPATPDDLDAVDESEETGSASTGNSETNSD
jgi:hypothetical protein